ncbi:hypothetical protein [Campylobacter sp. US33a]|uniref:hypothetical protein n=1 Tax=Campylobacter sp. US33a TaxID=2498120 RepID=UPI0014191731|nr:hypothetical protein [Campylobacter sp. US33a]
MFKDITGQGVNTIAGGNINRYALNLIQKMLKAFFFLVLRNLELRKIRLLIIQTTY